MDFNDKDLAIIAVLVIAVGMIIGGAFGKITDPIQVIRDCILVLGSVATGKALGDK